MWWPLKKRSQFQHKTKKKWKSMILVFLQHGHILLWFCKKKYAYQQKYTFLKDLVKHSLVALRIFEKDCLSTSWAVLSFPLDKGPGRKKTNINIRLQYDYLLTLIGAFTCKHVSLPTWKQCCQSTHNIRGYLAPLLLLQTFWKFFLLILLNL